jgi:hypothetical protein
MLGDLWGIENINPRFDDDKGSSLITINSSIGKELVEKIKNNTIIEPINIEDVIPYNPYIIESVKTNSSRDIFFNNLDNKTIEELAKDIIF